MDKLEFKIEDKKTFKQNIRSFLIKYPELDMILDFLSIVSEKIYLGYLIVFGVIIFIFGVMAFWMLPNDIREWATPTITTFFSLIIAPLFIKIYEQKRETKLKRFEKNHDLYVELLDILVLLVIDNENSDKHVRRFEKTIQDNYAHIYLNFGSVLFYDLMALHLSCENKSDKSKKYYVHKCIRNMRKECENSRVISISYEMEQILKNRK